jgi:hypothetical protein
MTLSSRKEERLLHTTDNNTVSDHKDKSYMIHLQPTSMNQRRRKIFSRIENISMLTI